jgi:hypothetical protein
MILSRRQILALRSGQTVYHVWGNTEHDLYVRASHVIGKRCRYKSNVRMDLDDIHVFQFVRRDRRPLNELWSLKRDETHASGLSGAFGDRYFTQRRQAERFLSDIRAGLYPDLMYWWGDRCRAFDSMDEMFLGIDRGLGGVVEPGDHEGSEYDVVDHEVLPVQDPRSLHFIDTLKSNMEKFAVDPVSPRSSSGTKTGRISSSSLTQKGNTPS